MSTSRTRGGRSLRRSTKEQQPRKPPARAAGSATAAALPAVQARMRSEISVVKLEAAQNIARGLLAMLSDAYASFLPDAYAAVGVSETMHQLASHVQDSWDALNEESMPERLRIKLANLVSPLETAAACIHILTAAIKDRVDVMGDAGDGVLKGFDDLAFYWPRLIIDACNEVTTAVQRSPVPMTSEPGDKAA